jgi:hypothetical protein
VTRRKLGEILPGPIEVDPTPLLVRDHTVLDARMMLTAAVAELKSAIALGAYDRLVLDWLADWDQPTIAVVASLLHRALTAQAPTVDQPAAGAAGGAGVPR